MDQTDASPTATTKSSSSWVTSFAAIAGIPIVASVAGLVTDRPDVHFLLITIYVSVLAFFRLRRTRPSTLTLLLGLAGIVLVALTTHLLTNDIELALIVMGLLLVICVCVLAFFWFWVRQLLFACLAGAVALTAIALTVRSYWLREAERRLQEAVAAVESSDPMWRWDDILAARADIPEEENSAPHVLAAAKLLPANWPTTPAVPREAGAKNETLLDRLGQVEPNLLLDESLADDLERELQRLAPVLDRSRPILSRPRGRHVVMWNKNVWSTLLPHLDLSRRFARMFRLEAMQRMQEGRVDEALGCVCGTVHTGRSIGDEPCIISQLIRTAIMRIALADLERAVAQGEPAPQLMREIQALIDDELEVSRPLLLLTLRAERAGVFKFLGQVYEGELTLEEATAVETRPRPRHKRFQDWLYVRVCVRLSQAYYLDFTERVLDIFQLPVKDQPAQWSEFVADCKAFKEEYPQLASAVLFIPAVDKVAAAFWRQRMELSCASLALAAERYRQETGRWPDKLEDLVPDYAANIPEDVYGEGPLRLGRFGQGIVIYSVGSDGEDNGGNIDRHNTVKTGIDFGFRLWHPEERRKPPAR